MAAWAEPVGFMCDTHRNDYVWDNPTKACEVIGPHTMGPGTGDVGRDAIECLPPTSRDQLKRSRANLLEEARRILAGADHFETVGVPALIDGIRRYREAVGKSNRIFRSRVWQVMDVHVTSRDRWFEKKTTSNEWHGDSHYWSSISRPSDAQILASMRREAQWRLHRPSLGSNEIRRTSP